MEQHDAGGEAPVPRSPVLLPALLGREANHLHQGLLPGPQAEDVPVQRRGKAGGETGEGKISRAICLVVVNVHICVIKLI